MTNNYLKFYLTRIFYEAGYQILHIYRSLFHPHTRGVLCVLTYRDEILLVQHSYGPRTWRLPGGTMKRNESPEEAVVREIREELGLSISPTYLEKDPGDAQSQ